MLVRVTHPARIFIRDDTDAGCPVILRADEGTENVCAGTAQIALRLSHESSMAATKSFMTGASVHNVVNILSYNFCCNDWSYTSTN